MYRLAITAVVAAWAVAIASPVSSFVVGGLELASRMLP